MSPFALTPFALTTHRPILFADLDNLDEVTAVSQYDGDGVTVTSTNGVPNKPSAGLLRAYEAGSYDDQGRLYRTNQYSVDQTTGAVSTGSLETDGYFDHRSDLVAVSAPGGLWTKQSFDGAGRLTATYATDGAGGTTWAAAVTAANDTVLEQQEQQYDAEKRGHVEFFIQHVPFCCLKSDSEYRSEWERRKGGEKEAKRGHVDFFIQHVPFPFPFPFPGQKWPDGPPCP